MSNPTDERGWSEADDRSDDGEEHGTAGTTADGVSTTALFAAARRRLREHPEAIVALVLAGVVVAGIDWLSLHDPVPTTGFTGVFDGRFAVSFGVVVDVLTRASVPPSALVGLEPQWLVWTLGLELVEFLAVAGAGAYALARLLGIRLTPATILRYAALVAVVRVGSVSADLAGGAVLLAIVLIPVVFVLLVRLFALPGLVIAGRSVGSALRESWNRTRGHGRSLVGVVLLVGLLNHLLASVPVVGPLGSALAGAVHAGVVAVFLRHNARPGERFPDGENRATNDRS